LLNESGTDPATPCLTEESSSPPHPFDELIDVATGVDGTANTTSEGEHPPPHVDEMETTSTGSNEPNPTVEPEMASLNASGGMDESHIDRQETNCIVSKVSLQTTQEDCSPIASPANSNQTKPAPSEHSVNCTYCGCGALLALFSTPGVVVTGNDGFAK
jgi:hypothetical protein